MVIDASVPIAMLFGDPKRRALATPSKPQALVAIAEAEPPLFKSMHFEASDVEVVGV